MLPVFQGKKDPNHCINGHFTLTVLSLLVSLFVFTSVFSVLSDPVASLDDFRLYGYGKDNKVAWMLKGGRAQILSNGHTKVVDYELKVNPDDESDETVVLTGPVLFLSSSTSVAESPEGCRFSSPDKFSAEASSVTWDTEGKKVGGEKLSFDFTGLEDHLSVTGTKFSYNYETELLTVSEGFDLKWGERESERLHISGRKLEGIIGDRISMEEDIVVITDSGWTIKTDQVVWDENNSMLTGSGSVEVSKPDRTVRGSSFSYSQPDNTLVVEGPVKGRVEL